MKKLALALAAILLLSTCSAFADVILEGEKVWDGDTPFEFTLMIDDSYEPDGRVVYEMLEKKTNVHVKLNLAPYQVQLEKMAVALSTGDYADVIAGWLLGTKDVIELGGDGTFLALEDYIAKYCPHIEEVLNRPGVRESMTLPDGHIYTSPYAIGEPEVTFKPYINQVWLERLGLEMPTTPEELKEVLIAFRDNDANGNGDPNDEIPFGGDTNNLNLGMCAGWFGIEAVDNNGYPFFAKKDGKLFFSANKPEFKEFIEYFADLYKENLIDPELFTQDLENWKAKGGKDLYGVSIGYGPGDWYTNYEKGTADYEKYGENAFTCLPVLKGCDNPLFHRNSNGVTLFRTQLAITDKCDEEKLLAILRWLDVLYMEENSVQAGNGLLGVEYEKIGDHLYREIYHKVGENGWTQEDEDRNTWARCFTQSMPRNMGVAKLLPYDKDEPDPSFMDLCDEVYRPYMTETFKAVWGANQEDAERKSIIETDLKSYIKSKIAQWVSGEADVNAEWDAYCQQLEAYGLSELTDIYAREQGLDIHEAN